MSYYSSGASTFRKQEQLSSRYRQKEQVLLYSRYGNKNQQTLSRQQLSSTVRNILPSQRQTILQQQQINDLERKIDLILMHNEKLQSQKQRYRLLYEQSITQNEHLRTQTDLLKAQKQQLRVQTEQLRIQTTERIHQSKTARFMTQENTFIIQKLRKELELTSKSYQQKLQDAYESRRVLKEQISTLTKIIEDVNRENKELKLSIKEQSLKVESLTFELKEEFIRQQAELQNKLRDQFLIREIQLKNEKKQMMETYEEQIKEIKDLVEKEKQGIELKKEQQINKLVQDFQQDKREMIREFKEEKERQIQKIEYRHREEIKRQQDKAIQYINSNINNIQQKDELIKQEYEEEINRLRESLQNRKILIDTLIANSTKNNQSHFNNGQNLPQQQGQHQQQHISTSQRQRQQKQDSSSTSSIQRQNVQIQLTWLPQLLAMKEQLQQQTTQYLQQSQLLKLKLTQKFHTDISSLKNVYENKIELISLHKDQLEQQNQRLRNIYENSLQQNIKNKKQYQLEKSKLKNIIRKLNIQLHGIQQEYKLNIEGVRSMNNTFSMTMMKSMIEVKQKASFFSQQNRKLRKAYQEHQNQLFESQRLNNQKVSYYEQKYQTQKQKSAKTISDLKHKLQLTQQQAQQRQSQLRDNLNKQHQMIHQLVSQLRKDLQKLQQQNQQLNKQSHHITASLKDKDQQITHLKSLINQLQADIEKLKLDLSMAGVDDQNHTDTINQWKNHYEMTISQLNQQIQILNSKLNTKHQQLIQIVKKYQLLQNNLNKVIKTRNKKSQLQNKVLQVGLDNNLVNNLAQLFGKEEKENILPLKEN